ncbi:MAG: 1-deoxy-D-xylulose-5-phosphate reductoisomerase [Parachlamydia sp.]|nr:1-deoxy-D-xylulose-5-phosphate reductoisomerase [Parachlamydia sp.]
MKRIAILGSTGSIGESTLKVVRHLGPEKLKVVTLASHSQIDLLEKQAREFEPELVAVYNKDKAQELKSRIPHIKVVGGIEGIEEAATHPYVDQVVSAITGSIGLRPAIAAICAGKNLALANKEPLVAAGQYFMSLARKHGVTILPVDSEHSALFQCLHGENPKTVRRLILTASGGPFRFYTDQQLGEITVEGALQHPNWKMGPKITIDCSTLMNKGLEVIEAHWLFGIPLDQIEVIVHPQSLIHSLVEYVDGSTLAQISEPSMVLPIQYALTYPERLPGMLAPFDFIKNSTLQFYAPDLKRFRCLDLAYQAVRQGGSLPCFMNAANEVLVQRFVNREIGWLEIGARLETLMERHEVIPIAGLEDIDHVEAKARSEAST